MDKIIERVSYYGLTITQDRYCGTYSGGKWLAFPTGAENLSFNYNCDFDGDDNTCKTFWENNTDPIGRGDTIEDAIKDLDKRFENDNRYEIKEHGYKQYSYVYKHSSNFSNSLELVKKYLPLLDEKYSENINLSKLQYDGLGDYQRKSDI